MGVQGNLDPAVMLASAEAVRREATRILAGYGHGEGHVFNLGHGILPTTPVDNVIALVDATTGAPLVASACPFCMTNIEDAIKVVNTNPYGNGTAVFTNSGGAMPTATLAALARRVGIGTKTVEFCGAR